jgi:hypothetical protein
MTFGAFEGRRWLRWECGHLRRGRRRCRRWLRREGGAHATTRRRNGGELEADDKEKRRRGDKERGRGKPKIENRNPKWGVVWCAAAEAGVHGDLRKGPGVNRPVMNCMSKSCVRFAGDVKDNDNNNYEYSVSFDSRSGFHLGDA